MQAIITDRKIKVAVVGCGRISANHFKAIAAHEADLTLTAVCDTNPVALRAAVDQHGVAGYASLAELLEKASVDAVVLCTPSGLASSAGDTGRRRRPPRDDREAHGDSLGGWLAHGRASATAGVRLFVVKQNRTQCDSAVAQASRGARALWADLHGHLNVFWARPQSYYDSAKWRGTWEFDGGALMNQASHYVDLVDWMIGPGRKRSGLHGDAGPRISKSKTPPSSAFAGAPARWAPSTSPCSLIPRTTKARSRSSARRARPESVAWP